MVALLGIPGMAKERLMVLAKEGGVNSESMGGDGGFYDGWAGTNMLLQRDRCDVHNRRVD
jgi:hypothetical protein